MVLRNGTYRVGAESGRLLVRTGRTGLGSRVGHDLTIEADAWSGTVTVDTNDPARSSLAVEVDVNSLRVVEGSGGVKPLTGSDRAEIERTMRDKILQATRHPAITFRSTGVTGTAESFTVDVDLTIVDKTRPVEVRGSLRDDGRVRATATVVQSRWGIKPYSAFFGALKVADEVMVEVDATLVPAG
ncbi:MAG TPA: YceI family protein [Amycolatopsis sp.]|uniref:YceI family protein n=1 Tax=Amycolatopsis sp. TaxID=37632 RepID=UPI002B464FD9|nr:YceI family protein [Amycolatopsis sp.]HKS47060.1 YceI family protein [Amycolatopsis sp.]